MSSARRSLRLFGYGRFGQALAELALDAGWEVRAYDPQVEVPQALRVADAAQLLQGGGLVMLAVPMASFRGLLEQLRPLLDASHTVLDVCSVKRDAVEAMRELCADDVAWVASHPLFGPMSIAMGESPLRVVVCPDTPHAAALRAARSFYAAIGCQVHEQASDEHDAAMAETHALAFFVAKGMLDMGVDQAELVPPSFRAMEATIESVRADAGHLFVPIQNANPHAAAARRRLLDALAEIDAELGSLADPQPRAGEHEDLAILPAAAGAAESIAELDGLEALDAELFELLARRTQLAVRAARARARAGTLDGLDAEHDRRRRARARAAAELHGLEGGSFGGVLDAILELGRAAERRALGDE